jgi:GxxExxY protein
VDGFVGEDWCERVRMWGVILRKRTVGEVFSTFGTKTWGHGLTQMDTDLMNDLTERVIGAVFEVSNTLGAGFLEKVYERALVRELKLRGIPCVAQAALPVIYKGQRVGDYCADLLVDGVLILELKCVERLCKEHVAQCLNYLRASGIELCLLVNFERPTVEWKRVVLTGDLRAVG